jgi:hypothetical protein
MQYKCKTIPLAKLIVTAGGIVSPLCNDCKSKDCDNPIEKISVSVLGIEQKLRVWNSRSSTSMVVQCEGYNP